MNLIKLKGYFEKKGMLFEDLKYQLKDKETKS